MDFWVDNVRYTIEDCDTKTILDLLRKILDKGVSVYSSSLDSRLTDAEAKIVENTTNIETNTTDINEALTRITTAEGNITELGEELNTTNSNVSAVTNEVTTARGGQACLNARLGDMTTATSNAASAASAAQTAAEAAQSDATTAQNTANEAAANANTANSNIAAAADTFDSLKARLDDMTTATSNAASAASAAQAAAEAAQSDASTAQTTANEAAANANTANSNIAAAAGSFDSLAARLNDMDTDITNVTTDVGTNTDDITTINTELSRARRGFDSLYLSVGEADFSGFGKILSVSAKSFWLYYPINVTKYYTAAGVSTSSDDPETAYTIIRYADVPSSLMISIANILTVTSDMLLASSLPPITVDGTLYTVFFIRLPNIEFNSNYSVNNAYLNTFPAIVGPSDPAQITMDMIGNTNSTGKVGLTAANANLYIPVLRPSTSPGTVFKFLYTAIDPDTNTVQYLTYDSQITVFL